MLTLTLAPSIALELDKLLRTSPLPYVRERASALLKVAAGQSCESVARHGLLQKRQPETVCGWVHPFKAEGIAGIYIRSGRGRHRTFSP